MTSVLKNKIEKVLGDKFVYCGIPLSTKGLKADGKPRKNLYVPLIMIKLGVPNLKRLN